MRRRILIAVVSMTSLAVAALFVPAALALRSSAQQEQELELKNEALAALADFHLTGELDTLEGHEFGIYDRSAHLVRGTGPPVADAVMLLGAAGTPGVEVSGGQLVAAIPMEDGMVLRAAEPITDSTMATRRAVVQLAAVAIAIVAVAAIVGVWLSRRINRPLAALSRAASSLGSGDFSVRADASGVIEVDRVASAMNHAAAALGELVTRERELTSHTSHQLRTPLAGMRVAVETELEAPRGDRTAVLHELLGAIDRMETAVSSLISLRRGASAPGTRSDVGALAAMTSQARRIELPAGRTLRVSSPPAPVLTSARSTAIEIALDVLVDNAVEHGDGDVHIAVAESERGVTITVADGGSIDADRDPFGQEPLGHRGVGLQMARRLVEAEGGELALAARAPTTFVITVPPPSGGE